MMLQFTFENQGTHTYLVYTMAEDDAVDSMSLGMLTNNKIHGLAHTLFTQMDATKYIKYDVSAKISAKQFFTGQVNKKRLLGVFNGIVDAMLSAEDYMIDINSILLDLDYIFADVSTCETVMVCLPIVSDDLSNKDLGVFFKNIMFTTQFDQAENCDHVAKIINYLNSSLVFSLADFKKLLDNIGEGNAPAQVQQPVVQKPQTQQTQIPLQTPVQQLAQEKAPVQPSVQQKPVVQSPVNQVGIQTSPAQLQPVQGSTPEKKSMFGWLTKREKTEKKSSQVQTVLSSAAQPKKQPTTGFAIPGQDTPVNQGFAIPGQPTPIQQATAQKNVQQPVQQPVQQKPVTQQPVPHTAVNNQPAYTQPQMLQGKSMNFGETTVLGGGNIGETTVLGATPATQVKPHLIRTKNNEKIDLNKPVFRIGKEKSYVDYFISDNSAISRSHANIITREGEYFVVDTNSTNHTYVNGQMIQSNVETKISHGTKIKLANEDFEFKLY